ncbi:MAG: hypothetical protein ACJ72Z_09685 [Pyrinomonadaceae bacterium]
MENYSSKICSKCYSVQEPWSRFCDNCGKAFAPTAAIDGNISVITKTFLKRQVSQTRPLFWLCIIIVGMLAVFGFAKAGVFRGSAPDAPVSQNPDSMVSRDENAKTVEAVVIQASSASDALDLNNSVFEMRDQTPAAHTQVRRTLVSKVSKPATKPAEPEPATETAEAATPVKTEVPAPKQPEVIGPKEENTAAAPKGYVRGPMGGCYYISQSGSKRYVDRSLCN